MNKVNEAYELAGQGRAILDLEHMIDQTSEVKTIDDVRTWLNARANWIKKRLYKHGFVGWENGKPKFSPELDYVPTATASANESGSRDSK